MYGDKPVQVKEPIPDGNHPHHRQDAGQHEDEAWEPVQGSLVDLGVAGDVGQARKPESQLQEGERLAWQPAREGKPAQQHVFPSQ